MRLDLALDAVGNSRFENKFKNMIKKLLKQTTLKELELRCVLLVYHKFALANDPQGDCMTKHQYAYFCDVYMQLYDIKLIERILMVLCEQDTIVKTVQPEAWIKMYQIYTSESLDEQIKFCFQVYDIYDYKFLTRDVITRFVSTFMIEEDDDTEELEVDMVELIMKRFDIDRDGKISFDDYSTTVKKAPALMQFLGDVIPAKSIKEIFSKYLF